MGKGFLRSRISRRDLLRAAPLLVPMAWPRLTRAAAGAAPVSPQAYQYAYVGTYTPNGGGIYQRLHELQFVEAGSVMDL